MSYILNLFEPIISWKWEVKVKSLSPVWLLATPWPAAHQAPLSMGFSRQEYWSGVPLPSPIIFWHYTNYILDLVLNFMDFSSKSTPCSFFSFCITERRPQYNTQKTMGPTIWLPDCQIQLLGYLTPTYDCLWNNARGKNTRSLHLCSSSAIHVWEPSSYISPCNPSWRGERHSSWGMSLHWLKIKATFLFLPNSVSMVFYLALVGRESQGFGGNNVGNYI